MKIPSVDMRSGLNMMRAAHKERAYELHLHWRFIGEYHCMKENLKIIWHYRIMASTRILDALIDIILPKETHVLTKIFYTAKEAHHLFILATVFFLNSLEMCESTWSVVRTWFSVLSSGERNAFGSILFNLRSSNVYDLLGTYQHLWSAWHDWFSTIWCRQSDW